MVELDLMYLQVESQFDLLEAPGPGGRGQRWDTLGGETGSKAGDLAKVDLMYLQISGVLKLWVLGGGGARGSQGSTTRR